MLLQLQQQQQWQYEQQFQTYESFSQILYDVPHGPVYASVIIAAIPFLIYLFYRKSYLRRFIITPAATLFYNLWYRLKDWLLERRVRGEYIGIVGKKIELKDIFRYGIYAAMLTTGFLILKNAFFFSLVLSQSMAPTLEEADLVLVESLTTENIEVGDIIVFEPPDRVSNPVVHRVISVGDDGAIKTKGDNTGIDAWTLTGEDIKGKVVTVGGNPVAIPGRISLGPLEIKSPGLYLMPRQIYLQGSDPVYEGVRDSIQWIHNRGPVILILLLLIILIGSFESRRKYKAIYN